MTAQVFHNILDKITSADVRVPFPCGKGTKGCRGEAAHGQVAECGLREFRASGSYYVKEGSTFRERQSQPEGKTFKLWLPFCII